MSQLYAGGSGTRCHCHFRKTSLYLLKQAKEGLKRIKLTKMEWGMSLCQNCTKGKQKKLQLQISNGNNNQKFMEIICLPLVYNQSPHFNQLRLRRRKSKQKLYQVDKLRSYYSIFCTFEKTTLSFFHQSKSNGCYKKTFSTIQPWGSSCGSVGREVASNIRGPRFDSSHRQICLLSTLFLKRRK